MTVSLPSEVQIQEPKFVASCVHFASIAIRAIHLFWRWMNSTWIPPFLFPQKNNYQF